MVGLSYLTLCAVAPPQLEVERFMSASSLGMDAEAALDPTWANAARARLSDEAQFQWAWPLAGGTWAASQENERGPAVLEYVSDRVSIRIEPSIEPGAELDPPSKGFRLISTRWPFLYRGAATLTGTPTQAQAALDIALHGLSAVD